MTGFSFVSINGNIYTHLKTITISKVNHKAILRRLLRILSSNIPYHDAKLKDCLIEAIVDYIHDKYIHNNGLGIAHNDKYYIEIIDLENKTEVRILHRAI